MNFSLKGLAQSNILSSFESFTDLSIGFDFRPMSLNFTQQYKVEKLVETLPTNIKEVILLFKNEKDFMVKSIHSSVLKHVNPTCENVLIELSGDTSLESIESYNIPYIWHYNQNQRIIDLEQFTNLRRIIFKHSFFEELNGRNELFGFLQLFKSLEGRVEFEILLDWDDSLIESALSYLTFSTFGFEMNHKVETSYQNLNCELIVQQLNSMNNLIKTI